MTLPSSSLRETVGQALAVGAKIDILIRVVDEILLAETPLGLGVRG